MGEIRKYTCSCGYEKELFTGAGLQGININTISRYISAEALKLFLKKKERGEVSLFLLENALVLCPECLELSAVPYFHYELTDGQQQIFLPSCPLCARTDLQIQNPEHIRCPKCSNTMEYRTVGNWD